MLFRLMVLLLGGLFVLLYFAPDAPVGEDGLIFAEEGSLDPAPDLPVAPAVAPATPEPAPQPVAPARVEPEEDLPPLRLDGLDGPSPFESAAAPSPLPADPADAAAAAAAEAAAAAAARLALSPDRLAGTTAEALSISGDLRNRAALERRETVETPAATDPAPAPEPEEAVANAEVVATSVNLRAGPSTANVVVGRVDFGDRVELLGEPEAGWSRIRHPDTGEAAYMASRFLQRLPQ